MYQKILPHLLIILSFAFSAFAQNSTDNLLENTNLRFFLEGEPTPQDAGFDRPKNFWKVKYALYLTDFSELEKLGLTGANNGRNYVLPLVQNRKFDKRIKKNSLKITQGNFTKKQLLNEANRKVAIPVNLSPNVIELFNQARKTPEKNPTFVLFVTEKVSVKNSAGAKLKKKYSITGFNPLKHAMSNQNFEYWDVRNLSLTISIFKQENGQLKLVGGFVQ